MAMWTIQTFKKLGPTAARSWTNVYHVRADTSADAITAAGTIVVMEKAIHKSDAYFTNVRVSTTAEGDDEFYTIVENEAGGVTRATEMLPLFNTVRVDIGVAGGGRPSRKYYRPPIEEAENTDGSLTGSAITFYEDAVQGLIDDLVAAGTPLVDPDDQEWVGAAVQAAIQMRQLHRKRKKVVAP
jgi:hypothetical protein